MIKTIVQNKIIESTSEKNCSFCMLLKSDRNITHVLNLEYGGLYLNYNQSYNGRCLYIPYQHFSNLKDIPKELFINYNQEIYFITNSIQELLEADLVNIAMLSNTVRHIHWHLIPRFKDDENWGFAPWPTKEKRLNETEINILKEKIQTALILA